MEATSTPLPTALGGTNVLIGDQPAFLFSVSPREILFQLPNYYDSPAGRRLVVRTPDGMSSPLLLNITYGGRLGVFTKDGTECGPPLLFNLQTENGETVYRENSQAASVAPEGFITIFGTGVSLTNDVSRWPVPGVPTPNNPVPANPILVVNAYAGERSFRIGNTVFAGRVPGLIGVDQVNIRIDENAPQGCDLPVRLTSGYGTTTADFPLSIGRGGQCQEPPALGKVLWKQTTISATEGSSVSDTLEVAIRRSPFPNDVIPHLPPFGPTGVYVPEPSPACREDQSVHHLSIDRFQLTPESQVPLMRQLPELRNGFGYRQIDLPAGSIRPGRFAVGIEDQVLGSAESMIRIPEPIRVTTDLRPGTTFFYRPPGSFSVSRCVGRGATRTVGSC